MHQSAVNLRENFELAGSVANDDKLAVRTERHARHFIIHRGLKLADHFSLVKVPVGDPAVKTESQELVLSFVEAHLDDARSDYSVWRPSWRRIHLLQFLQGLLSTHLLHVPDNDAAIHSA